MGVDDALKFADELVKKATGESFDSLTRAIFRGAWDGQTYEQIAQDLGYEYGYVREKGSRLCKVLSQVLGESVTKPNFRAALERRHPTLMAAVPPTITPAIADNADFVGRERAIFDLNQLVSQGTKVIVIQGEGGLGKTTIARKYLDTQGFDLQLELWMPTEQESITPAESVVEEWLRGNFNEETERDFGINLERLRRKLRDPTRRIGILIDNLESALNGEGRFIDTRRPYVDLLRVLADFSVRSVTLITSRERLFEDKVTVEHYFLNSLSEDDWRQFFNSRQIRTESGALSEMWRSYGGNAKAMKILSGAILSDAEGDIEAYWQENRDDLLIEQELNHLVASQFSRLQTIDPDAYRLLCRLGCYRYQDIPFVSTNGVSDLLWDLPSDRHRRVIKSLLERSLLEGRRGQKYWLHPVIRAMAIARLRPSDEWTMAHQKAAEFWMQSVPIVNTVDDALRALEAYHHYVEINDFELACDVIVEFRNSQWGEEIPLGWLFYRLGLMEQMVSAINRIIDNVKPDHRSGMLYNLLGYIYRLAGNFQSAIECHQKAGEISAAFNQDQFKVSTLLNLGLCKKDLWEVEAAIEYFNQVYSISQQDNVHSNYLVYSQCCLAYLYSSTGSEQLALEFANQVDSDTLLSQLSTWGAGYSLLYLAATYRNVGEIERSSMLYQKTTLYSEENHFTQIKANALHGSAQLYREQRAFELAISHHSRAIELLSKIGAKCDLAEAHLQFGITYQRMSLPEDSRVHFYHAMQLFSDMNAPKRVERVRGFCDFV